MSNPSTPTKRRILLVDDDSLILALLADVLQHGGYETSEATSGEDALKQASECAPDLALLDIGMPGMSGMELAKCLQSETTVPFMILSAYGEIEVVRQATEYGAVGYLVKPVDPAQIIPTVEAALARADEIKRLRRTETNLTVALAAGRETSMAVGLLIARYETDRNTAFEVLRDYARSRRRKIDEVANELLAAEEVLGVFKVLFLEQSRHK